jgi:hypothetical protein
MPKIDDEVVRTIVAEIGVRFPTFGGGISHPGNPIADALKDRPLQFAAGVDVEQVVRFILDEVSTDA